jgi:hypothetical protein
MIVIEYLIFLRESSCPIRLNSGHAFVVYTLVEKTKPIFEKSNGRKVNYNKEMRRIYLIGHLVKTNPIKPILFSPQHCWGLKNQFEKTKPIYTKRGRLTKSDIVLLDKMRTWDRLQGT